MAESIAEDFRQRQPTEVAQRSCLSKLWTRIDFAVVRGQCHSHHDGRNAGRADRTLRGCPGRWSEFFPALAAHHPTDDFTSDFLQPRVVSNRCYAVFHGSLRTIWDNSFRSSNELY